MTIKFSSTVCPDMLQAGEYLLGYPVPVPNHARVKNWNQSKLVLASPLKAYLAEISRFTLDLGVNLDLAESSPDDIRQTLINQVAKNNRLVELMGLALERLSLTGAVYWVFRPDQNDIYRLYLYDQSEVMPDDAGGWLIQSKSGPSWVRYGISDTEIVTYKPTRHASQPWAVDSRESHGYSRAPLVKISGDCADHSRAPTPAFDRVALDLAYEIYAQVLASSANHLYFGGPLIVSSDPDKTGEELMNRGQVVTGRMSTDLQDTAVLAAPAMPDSHRELLETLQRNFHDYLGISYVPSEPPSDISSLTLRLLHAKTLNRASRVGTVMLDGVCQMLTQILEAAPVDGVYSAKPGVVQWSFQSEPFPLTSQDKLTTLAIVEQLTQLGIKPEIALEEFYPQKTTEEITDLLTGY